MLCLLALFAQANATADGLAREIWAGKFVQTAPIPWQGEVELYLRYDPEESYPQKIEGILTWKNLDGTKTRVVGTRSEKEIQFLEDKCVATTCSRVVLGGNYQGEYSQQGARLSGEAELPLQGLEGTFNFRRLAPP